MIHIIHRFFKLEKKYYILNDKNEFKISIKKIMVSAEFIS